MTTKTFCDYCDAPISPDMGFQLDRRDTDAVEGHFHNLPCLMGWLQEQQTKYGFYVPKKEP